MTNKFTEDFIQQQLQIAEKATPRPWRFNVVTYSRYPDQGVLYKLELETARDTYDEIINDVMLLHVSSIHYPEALREIARLRKALKKIIDYDPEPQDVAYFALEGYGE